LANGAQEFPLSLIRQRFRALPAVIYPYPDVFSANAATIFAAAWRTHIRPAPAIPQAVPVFSASSLPLGKYAGNAFAKLGAGFCLSRFLSRGKPTGVIAHAPTVPCNWPACNPVTWIGTSAPGVISRSSKIGCKMIRAAQSRACSATTVSYAYLPRDA